MPLPSLHKHELLQREYGQQTYQLIQGLREVEDKAERTRRAAQIVQLIFRLQPTLRDQPDAQQRVWNHLYEMADEDLDIDAPFELHGLSQLNQHPKPIPYPKLSPKLKAYGRSVELMVEQALKLEDPAEREQATVTIGRTMKFLYRSHNKENAKDVTILKHLKDLSGGQLTLDPALVETQGLFEFATGSAPAVAATGGSSRAAFIVPQPRQDRDGRRGNNNGGGSGGNNNRRDKQRRGGKKGRQEPQQPPQ